MGLDLVELVMAFEEEFGVDIPDHDAERANTPRKLADYIFQRCKDIDGTICHSQSTFYSLRRSLIEEIRIPRNLIKLDSKIQDFISFAEWNDNWETVYSKSRIGHNVWPNYSRPSWMRYSILMTSASLLISLWLFIAVPFFINGIISFIFFIVLLYYTKQYRVFDSPHADTIRDLVRSVSKPIPPKHKWTIEQIRSRARAIVIDQLGITDEQFSWDAKWIEDLGCA